VDVREPRAGKKQVLLLVDDEVDILESLRDIFLATMDDIEVLRASSGDEGLEVLDANAVDLILTDYKMPGMNGLEFLDAAKRLAPGVPRILITAFPDLDIAIRAINEAGIENFITKPFEAAQVIDTVRSILAERRAAELRHQSFARSLDVLRRQVKPSR
jgi:YesN/AraC family two-component response regulator